VDVFSGPNRVVNNIAYPGADQPSLSAPVQVPPGSYPLDVFPNGNGTRHSGPPVFTVNANNLVAGGRYLASATGVLNENPQNPTPSVRGG
jgi:hypothetical protein